MSNQAKYDANLAPLALVNGSIASDIPPSTYGCTGYNSTTYQEWLGGVSDAELVFDIGDGNSNVGCVTWAIQTARQAAGFIQAGLPDYAVIGAGYYSTGGSDNLGDGLSCKPYTNPNHAAAYTALTTQDQGAPHQWTATCGTDAGSNPRIATISDTIWTANMLVAPNVLNSGTEAIGNLQQQYGWLFPWNIDTGSETGAFHTCTSDTICPPGLSDQSFQKTQQFYTYR
jgi:hypothetical protein